MVRNKGKLHLVGERKETDKKGRLEDDVDSLFRLPLSEFTGARNALAALLKKSGSGADANQVKALTKPSISAWTANQLYWQHRDAFDRLIESGARFHKAQSSGSSGKLADMRGALDARRDALSTLSELATSLLTDAGHNPTPDTIHRITTTLEAMSVYASRSDAPPPGRLTGDVDPPGFESLGAFAPSSAVPEKPSRSVTLQKTVKAPTKAKSETDARQLEATRKANIATAKASMQEARKALSDARDRQKHLQAAQKKANAEARVAEKRLESAQVASEIAVKRVRSVAVEVNEAARSVEDADRSVEKASEELEKLLADSSAR